MNARSRYILSCLAVGVLTVTILAVLGLLARRLYASTLSDLTRSYNKEIHVSPLGLLPEETENAPDVVAKSEVVLTPRVRNVPGPSVLGGPRHFLRHFVPGVPESYIFHWEQKTDGEWLYYDKGRGLVVYSMVDKDSVHDRENGDQRVWLYAGPEGIADAPDKALGRFRSPIVSVWASDLVVYDAHQQCFFRVDFTEKRVTKGPQLDPAHGHEPIQIGAVGKHSYLLSWHMEPPLRKLDPNEPEPRPGQRRVRGSDDVVHKMRFTSSLLPSPYLFVLNASGRIDLLDKETLDIAGRAGGLPQTPQRFGLTRSPARPESLLAYDVQPILIPTDDAFSRWEYRGCAVGAFNYDGTHMSLAVFDSRGLRVSAARQQIIDGADVPGGPMVMTAQFILENLHPPALSLLSHFAAPHCPAGSAYRSIFALPDSLVAAQGRNHRQHYAMRLLDALLVMMPAMVLALILAILVARNAQVVGFSKDARTAWILITIAFGLPGYITYRLTRPRATLVTCANCGKPRRPDLDLCHQCSSPWSVPELDPPTWRVLDATRMNIDESPPPKKAATD